MPSNFNIFVGSENGVFKGLNSSNRSFKNLNDLDGLDASKEIVAMCWCDDAKQDEVIFEQQ